jgi:hypothetical protein
VGSHHLFDQIFAGVSIGHVHLVDVKPTATLVLERPGRRFVATVRGSNYDIALDQRRAQDAA